MSRKRQKRTPRAPKRPASTDATVTRIRELEVELKDLRRRAKLVLTRKPARRRLSAA
jgi:hypothetical protein